MKVPVTSPQQTDAGYVEKSATETKGSVVSRLTLRRDLARIVRKEAKWLIEQDNHSSRLFSENLPADSGCHVIRGNQQVTESSECEYQFDLYVRPNRSLGIGHAEVRTRGRYIPRCRLQILVIPLWAAESQACRHSQRETLELPFLSHNFEVYAGAGCALSEEGMFRD